MNPFQSFSYSAVRFAAVVALAAPLFATAISTAEARRGHGGGSAFNSIDADESGTVSLDEYLSRTPARAERRFGRKDKNDDGLITSDEYPQARAHNPNREAFLSCVSSAIGEAFSRPSWDEYLEGTDLNADDSIDVDEFTTASTAKATSRFETIDANADGELTREEMREARLAHREQRLAKRSAIRTCREQIRDSATES